MPCKWYNTYVYSSVWNKFNQQLLPTVHLLNNAGPPFKSTVAAVSKYYYFIFYVFG